MKKIPARPLLIAIACLGAGIFIGKNFFSGNSSVLNRASDGDAGTEVSRLREKLTQFSETDLENYMRLKSLEERYQKADELIGKMILILLTDVGVHVSKNQEAFAKNPGAALATLAATSSAGGSGAGTAEADKEHAVPNPAALANTGTPPQAWLKNEAKLSQLRDEKEMGDFLKIVRVPDLSMQLASAPSLAKAEPAIAGCFEGDLDYTDGSNRHHVVSIVTEYGGGSGKTEDSIAGSSTLVIYDGGKAISNHRSVGDLRTYRKLANGSTSLIIEASPTDQFQFYYVPDRDLLIGNFYEKKGAAEYAVKGTAILSRAKQCEPIR